MPSNKKNITKDNASKFLISALKTKNLKDAETILSKFVPLNAKIARQHIELAGELGNRELLTHMLKTALSQKDLESINQLVKYDVDVDIAIADDYEYEKITLIHFAIDKNDSDLAKLILEKDPHLMSKYSEIDFYPVSYAIGNEYSLHSCVDLGMIRTLLEHGGSPNDWHYEEGTITSPIYTAFAHKRKDILELLINYGGEWDEEDRTTLCPLSSAVSSNDVEMVEYLLKTLPGVATDLRQAADDVRETPIVIALDKKYWDIAKTLMSFELERDSNILANEEELKHFLGDLDAFQFMIKNFSFTDNAFDCFIDTQIQSTSITNYRQEIQMICDKYDDFQSKLFTQAVLADNVPCVSVALSINSGSKPCVSHDVKFNLPDQGSYIEESGSALDYAIQNNLSDGMIDLLYAQKVPCMRLQKALQQLITRNNSLFYKLIDAEQSHFEHIDYGSLFSHACMHGCDKMADILIRKAPEGEWLFLTEYKRHKLYNFIEQHGSMIIKMLHCGAVTVRDKLEEIFSNCNRDFMTLLPIADLVCLKEPNSKHIDQFESRSVTKHIMNTQGQTAPIKHPLRQAKIYPGSILTLENCKGTYIQVNPPNHEAAIRFVPQENHPDMQIELAMRKHDLNERWAEAEKLAEAIKQELDQQNSDGPVTKKIKL
ncbi:MAG: ankyrin repeat domain-containing protein [Pseudomonadota bacterium]|nr:ankyrin repeat domain-containing protein [Pseudomonadota bacterium]